MGLFDSLQFNPQAFSGQGGGLLDLLRTLQVQPTASNGFDPVQPPDYGQTGNVQIGNYIMPQFGAAAPDPAALPPTSQPTQGQAPPQIQQRPVMASPQTTDFGDRLMAGFSNFANAGGLLPALAGGLSGLVTGQRNDPTSRLQDQQNATYSALIAKGIPEAEARAAMLNPEILKTVAAKYFEAKPPAYGVIGEDTMGRKQYGFIDPYKQTVSPGNQGTAAAKPSPISNLMDAGVTGDAFLKGVEADPSLGKGAANTIRMMVEGRLAPPTSFAMSKPYWQTMIQLASQYDPTFDATAWAGRSAGVKDFSSGKSAEMVRAANQTLHHVGGFLDSLDALNNGRIPALNSIGNYVNEVTGGGAPGAFRTNAHAVAEEMSKVFKGSNLSDAEIRQWEQNLSDNMSPEQQRTQVGKLRELLTGSLHALEEKRLNSMGPIAAQKAGPLIKEEGQAVLQKIDDWLAKGGADKSGRQIKPQQMAPGALTPGQSTVVNGVTIRRVN